MTFDAAMSQISATLGLSTEDIKNNVNGAGGTFDLLREKALQMGSETNFSATEASEGLNILAMSGYDAYDSMDMIEDVLHLAAAGSMDMASAAGYVTGAMKGFNDETKDSAYYADLMAKGATLANTDVSALGEALSDGAASAKTYGQSAETTTIALLRLAEQGEVGSAASTALAAAMKNLYAPTDQAKKVLQALGVNAFDPATGAARDFNGVVNELDMALSGYTDEQKTAYAQTIFGIQGFDAYNKMVVTSTEKQEEWTKALTNSTGEAAKQYDTMTDNLLGDVDKWNSAVEGFQIVLSDQLTPTLREFVQFGSEAVSSLSTAFQEGGLSGAMEALGSVLSDGLNMVIEQLPKMVDAGMKLLGALGQGLIDNLPTITSAAVEIVTMLAEGLIGALPALAEGAVQIVSQLASGIGDALPELIPAAVEAVLKFVEGLSNPESFKKLIDGAAKLIDGLIEGLSKSVPLLIAYVPEIIANLVTGIIAAIPQMLEVGVQLIMGLIDGLIQGILAIPEAIARVVNAVIDGFKALFGIHSPSTVFAEMGKNLIAGLLQGISETWQTIVSFFSTAAEALISFLHATWETIRIAAAAAWEAIVEVFRAAWDAIQTAWSVVVDFFAEVWQGVQDVFSVVAEVLGGFFSAAWDAIVAVWDAAAGFFSGIADGIHSAFEAVTQFLSDTFQAAWNAIEAVWSIAAGFFSGIWEGISGVFSAAADFFGGVFSDAWNAVTSAWSGVKEFFRGVWDSITSVFRGVLDKFKEIGGNIVNGLKNGVLGAWDSFTSMITSKVGGMVSAVKGMLGIHSPSKVFAGIGSNMALGLAEGWDSQYSGIKRQIEGGMDFGTAGLSSMRSGGSYAAQYAAPAGGGNTYVTIHSPKAVDAVEAAREWQKTCQRMALGLI